MVSKSSKKEKAEAGYQADHERGEDNDLPFLQRKIAARKLKRSASCTARCNPRRFDVSKIFYPNNPKIFHQTPQALDCRNGIAVPIVRPRMKGNHEQLTGTEYYTETSSVVRRSMDLDDRAARLRGTPAQIAPWLESEDRCEFDWLRYSVNCGSIEQLAEHRSRHQARSIQVYGYETLDERRILDAFMAVVMHEYWVTQERWDSNTLLREMSKQDATPGEWRLLKIFRAEHGLNSRCALSEARSGIKGAKIEFPGIGRKSAARLRHHIHEQVTALYRKYGVYPPSDDRLIATGRRLSGDMRCQQCVDNNGSFLACVGEGRQRSCKPCRQEGFDCERRDKSILAERDGLRVALLRNAAMKHLRRPVLTA